MHVAIASAPTWSPAARRSINTIHVEELSVFVWIKSPQWACCDDGLIKELTGLIPVNVSCSNVHEENIFSPSVPLDEQEGKIVPVCLISWLNLLCSWLRTVKERSKRRGCNIMKPELLLPTTKRVVKSYGCANQTWRPILSNENHLKVPFSSFVSTNKYARVSFVSIDCVKTSIKPK